VAAAAACHGTAGVCGGVAHGLAEYMASSLQTGIGYYSERHGGWRRCSAKPLDIASGDGIRLDCWTLATVWCRTWLSRNVAASINAGGRINIIVVAERHHYSA